jgi:rhodanese-related sulfurtransferase/rubrerythrin
MIRWKQFLVPVKSLDTVQTKAFIDSKDQQQVTLLDVRQPAEYEKGHIPGALLIPLPELPDRFTELDPEKTHVVYCAVGGRSRMAAQMLAGRGFDKVINVSGGFNAWGSETAIGNETLGMTLFTGKESPLDTLVVAYSLEQGLRDFYLTTMKKMANTDVRQLFSQLAEIELKHQEKIYQHYIDLSGDNKPSREEFESRVVADAMEGGLSSEEYARRFTPDWNSPVDIISLAMSIEAQALDMYSRAAQRAEHEESRNVLNQIAREERSHLTQLGKLMDNVA